MRGYGRSREPSQTNDPAYKARATQSRIVVTGCAAQTEPKTFSEMAEVDRVLGNASKTAAETWFETKRAFDFGVGAEEKVVIGNFSSVCETASHLVGGFEGRARAFVQIQNGCDHRCTFCIIPYGRGPSRSVPMGEVVAQIRRLVENKYREIVLTGVDLTAWGNDLPGNPRLGALVRAIFETRLNFPGFGFLDRLHRGRPGSPRRACGRGDLMPHLHLSLQAGDDLILKRMKRRHLRSDAVAFCERVRRLRPGMVFGADLIAGFPTETENQFRNSAALIEDCGITFVHVFPFSPRAGTPAARMPQVSREIAKDRARRLREKGQIALHRHLESQVGHRSRVLIEHKYGRSEDFTEVKLAGPATPGTILDMTMTGHDGKRLLAA